MAASSLTAQIGSLAIGVATALILAVSSWPDPNATQPTGSPLGSATPMGAIYDSGLGAGDEVRAGFGNIFIGELLEVTGQGEVKTSDPEIGIPLTYYLVSVEHVLTGDVEGKIKIRVDDIDGDAGTTEHGEEPLKVGGRYLFFAGTLLPSGVYRVTAGLGTSPIENPT